MCYREGFGGGLEYFVVDTRHTHICDTSVSNARWHAHPANITKWRYIRFNDFKSLAMLMSMPSCTGRYGKIDAQAISRPPAEYFQSKIRFLSSLIFFFGLNSLVRAIYLVAGACVGLDGRWCDAVAIAIDKCGSQSNANICSLSALRCRKRRTLLQFPKTECRFRRKGINPNFTLIHGFVSAFLVCPFRRL